ncbi:MAG: hypothetical protein WC756_21645 [Taibaiella sp.]|jgi:hypothetical protein
MKRMLIALLLTLSVNAHAVDQHTFIQRVDITEVVEPHTTYTMPGVKLPIDMDPTHVWTGVGMCMLPGDPTDKDYNPFTEQLVLQGWLRNIDDDAVKHQYYFNSVVDSQHVKCVYQAFTPENNVHMHHKIRAVLECKNFGNKPAFCRARMWIHYKK